MVIDFRKKRGTLFLTNFYNYDVIETKEYWYCESQDDILALDAKQKRGLGLSSALTKKRNQWLEKGQLVLLKDHYLKLCFEELSSTFQSLQDLDELQNRLENGEKIVLFSFIDDVDYSHIKIIGDLIKSKGYRVKILDKNNIEKIY